MVAPARGFPAVVGICTALAVMLACLAACGGEMVHPVAQALDTETPTPDTGSATATAAADLVATLEAERATATMLAYELSREHTLRLCLQREYESCVDGWSWCDATVTAATGRLIYQERTRAAEHTTATIVWLQYREWQDVGYRCHMARATDRARETMEPCAWRVRGRVFLPMALTGW